MHGFGPLLDGESRLPILSRSFSKGLVYAQFGVRTYMQFAHTDN